MNITIKKEEEERVSLLVDLVYQEVDPAYQEVAQVHHKVLQVQVIHIADHIVSNL